MVGASVNKYVQCHASVGEVHPTLCSEFILGKNMIEEYIKEVTRPRTSYICSSYIN